MGLNLEKWSYCPRSYRRSCRKQFIGGLVFGVVLVALLLRATVDPLVLVQFGIPFFTAFIIAQHLPY